MRKLNNMTNSNLLDEAKSMQPELVKMRRYLHMNAETGFALNKTFTYVKGKLEHMGYQPQKCGKSGIVATVGTGKGKTVLLRADMDALPVRENSGESFSATNGNMHACGHDMHTAMLLGAASLLKKRESQIKGNVKLLFQPAEEIFQGAKNVIQAGALLNPKISAAIAVHVATATELPTGHIVVSSGIGAPAADYFTVKVRGKGCHGATPWKGVDALTVAAHILIAFQEIPARELSLSQTAVFTVGSVKTHEAGNAIANSATLNGTLRTYNETVRRTVKKRMEEIALNVAKGFRATATIEFKNGCPPLINDAYLAAFAEIQAKNLFGESAVINLGDFNKGANDNISGSEDFAFISQKVPSITLAIAAGEKTNGYKYPLHHPKSKFDESALYIGSALYSHFGTEWLKTETQAQNTP